MAVITVTTMTLIRLAQRQVALNVFRRYTDFESLPANQPSDFPGVCTFKWTVPGLRQLVAGFSSWRSHFNHIAVSYMWNLW